MADDKKPSLFARLGFWLRRDKTNDGRSLVAVIEPVRVAPVDTDVTAVEPRQQSGAVGNELFTADDDTEAWEDVECGDAGRKATLGNDGVLACCCGQVERVRIDTLLRRDHDSVIVFNDRGCRHGHRISRADGGWTLTHIRDRRNKPK